MKQLAIVGSLCRDLRPGLPPRAGGAPIHAARALRALRRPGIVAAKVGAADREALLGELVPVGVTVRCLAARTTTSFAFDYDGDVRRMSVEATGDPWTPEDARGWLARSLDRVDWVHVSPLLRTDFSSETLAVLARGRRVLLDGQGIVRVARTGPLELDGEFDRDLLRHVAILKLSEEEAVAAAGGTDVEALRSLGVPEVVVTLGSRGSLVLAGRRLERVPATSVRGEVDPTGAGDAFSIAYLSARSGGHAPTAAARRASALVAALLAGKSR